MAYHLILLAQLGDFLLLAFKSLIVMCRGGITDSTLWYVFFKYVGINLCYQFTGSTLSFWKVLRVANLLSDE